MTTVPKACIPQLLPWLRQFLPKSFKVYGEVQSCVSSQWRGVEFVVDRWPSPKAVIARAESTSTKKFENSKFLENLIIGVFAEDGLSLTALLKTPGVVSWTQPLTFCCVADTFWSAVEEAAKECGGECSSSTELPNWLLKATPQDVSVLPVPEDMKLVTVTEDMVNVVISTWKFASEGVDSYITAKIRYLPSLALVTDTNQHVGHMIGQSYRAMGMLYVLPEFRGRGCGKVIITNLAKKYFDEGEDAYVIIEESNPASLALHQSVGFTIVPDAWVKWIQYNPRGDQQAEPVEGKCCL